MSTCYRVTGQGVRLTFEKLVALAAQTGGFVVQHPVVETGQARVHVAGTLGCVWHYRSGKDCWNEFEVFSSIANGQALTMWLEVLAAAGYSTLSEHDEGYFR